jgi:biopolymer transport protein TolQ
MKNIIAFLLPASGQSNLDYIELIADASIVVKLVLLILLFFSVMSWAIIIFKLLEYSNVKKSSLKFLSTFRRKKNFSDIQSIAMKLKNCPLAEIFRYGYNELSLQVSSKDGESDSKINVNRTHRALVRASNIQIVRLEKLNGFIATTAAATPFIGLFGTVWGIMSSFHQIGIQMNANLATVAPGIAEALIATALGLFAAIPAVIFYNLLLNKLKVMISTMEDFINEFLNVSERLK